MVVSGYRSTAAVFNWWRSALATVGGSSTILNIGMWLIVGVAFFMGYIAFVQPLDPVTELSLRAIFPPSQVINRETDTLRVTRTICLNQAATARVSRSFIDGVVYPMPDTYISFDKGCNTREAIIDVPDSLAPGNYLYRVALTWCNQLRCETRSVPDIPIAITGAWPPVVHPPIQPHSPL